MSLPILEEPSLSFAKLKKIKLGENLLENYQKKLIELRKNYDKELSKYEKCSFYHNKIINFHETSQIPLDNVFATFHYLTNKNHDNQWILYWNPNLENEDNKNLNWDLLSKLLLFAVNNFTKYF